MGAITIRSLQVDLMPLLAFHIRQVAEMVELYMQKGLTPSHARRVVADMVRLHSPIPISYSLTNALVSFIPSHPRHP